MAVEEAKTSEGATIGQKLDQVIDTTREKLSHVSAEARERIAKGRESVAELREKSRESIADLRKKNVDDVVTSAKEFAKEHPGTTLIGGIAIGFLVGYLFKRRD